MKTRQSSCRYSLSLSLVLASVLLAGCARTAALTSTPQNPGTNAASADGTMNQTGQTSDFAAFPDLPFPPLSKLDIERSFIVGSDENWFGQAVANTPSGSNAAYDFYRARLPELGWMELSSVRAQTSVLTYTREQRVLTIQLSETHLGNADILVTVSPRNDAGTGAGAQSIQ